MDIEHQCHDSFWHRRGRWLIDYLRHFHERLTIHDRYRYGTCGSQRMRTASERGLLHFLDVTDRSAQIATVQGFWFRIQVEDSREKHRSIGKLAMTLCGFVQKKPMICSQCVDSRGRTVATWGQAEQTLRVEGRVESILDRIVVTCLLHIWMRRQGQW